MSILVECISVIVRRDTLARLYPGGVEAYEADCPNATFCADAQLARVGFMTPADARAFVDRLVALGFTFTDDAGFVDIAVVDQVHGPTAPCDWLRFGCHDAGYLMAWAPGTRPSPMSAPAGWRPGRTESIRFIDADEHTERLVPMGRRGNFDVFLDLRRARRCTPGARMERDGELKSVGVGVVFGVDRHIATCWDADRLDLLSVGIRPANLVWYM